MERERLVWTGRKEQLAVPVYDMEKLQPGHVIQGPALLDAVDTTLWAPANSTVTLADGSTFVTRFNADQDR